MPCNTAHYWYPELSRGLKIPFLHIVDSVVDELSASVNPRSSIGLLATTGTIKSMIYQKRASTPYRWIVPDDHIQRNCVDPAIDAVKEGMTSLAASMVSEAIHHLAEKELVDAIVLGCTELPIACEVAGGTQIDKLSILILDSTAALARSTILRAGGEIL
jgi:aspartate racemase